ncbi:unnamed protein product [Toxocara canis]|uniref:Glutaredoxin domain-containing protein n=1 Tax=Toxocara canis TaxID=6265 RepID=A0A183V1Y8_TOXCA|nr:unnamed protein product [Toxocara canis]
MAARNEEKPVWVYVIFRKNHCSGHEKMTVNISFDGPIFWNRQVAYIYCCSCHFHEHEGPLLALLRKFEHRVERVCIVDKPVDYAFLPDSFFSYMAKNMPRLQFIYLRELDLEKINRGTVVELAEHTSLKKVIVHGCRNYEVLQDFSNLPQLLVVKGEIVGLKVGMYNRYQKLHELQAMIGDLDFEEPPNAATFKIQKTPKTSTSSESTSEPSSSNSKQSSTSQLTAVEVGMQNVTVAD